MYVNYISIKLEMGRTGKTKQADAWLPGLEVWGDWLMLWGIFKQPPRELCWLKKKASIKRLHPTVWFHVYNILKVDLVITAQFCKFTKYHWSVLLKGWILQCVNYISIRLIFKVTEKYFLRKTKIMMEIRASSPTIQEILKKFSGWRNILHWNTYLHKQIKDAKKK